MSPGIWTAIISGVVALGVATLSLFGARSAQKTTAQTQQRQNAAEKAADDERRERDEAQARAVVEAQAYTRARESYERIVKDLEQQLERNQRTVERVQTQLDVVMERLGREQDVSNALRTQIRVLQDRVEELQRENQRFQASLADHQRVNGALDRDLRQAGIVPPT